jgi:hypothetical protein
LRGLWRVLRSDLAATRPALPETKDECKDGGFATFEMFKNQGDCVSFVETGGTNEPGKNTKP